MGLFRDIETVLLSHCGEKLLIKFPFTEERKDQVKYAVPGAHFDRAQKVWVSPVGQEQVDALKALKFRITEEALNQIPRALVRASELIEASRAESAELEIPGFGKQPFPFQKAGIKYAMDRKRVIIGDEMGLGKTIQGLGTVYATNAFPCLILVPASLKYNWQAEVDACVPGKIVHVADKETGSLLLQMADVIVTNYEQLIDGKCAFEDSTKKEVRLSPLGIKLSKYCKFKSVLLDEAHYIKNAAAARTMATQKICDAIETIEYRILLTGTPMLNRPSEFYSLLKFLKRIDEFGGYWHFMTYFCGLEKTKFGMQAKGANHAKELNDGLRASCYVRRKKKDVLKELPDKLRTTYYCDITNWAEYKRAKKDVVEWVKERVLKDKEFLDSIAHHPQYQQELLISQRQADKAERAERGEMMVRLTALKRVAAEGKLKAAKDWIDNFLESGEKLVIFATHKFMLDQLVEWYPKSARIRSEMSAEERQHNVQRFQSDPTCGVIIGAMGTSAANSPAGVGHTLTAASHTLFLELGWNNALHDQCEDRCHRIGQKDNVTAHYLISKGTIEEWLARIIEDKRAISAQVVDGTEDGFDGGILDRVIELLMEEVA